MEDSDREARDIYLSYFTCGMCELIFINSHLNYHIAKEGKNYIDLEFEDEVYIFCLDCWADFDKKLASLNHIKDRIAVILPD